MYGMNRRHFLRLMAIAGIGAWLPIPLRSKGNSIPLKERIKPPRLKPGDTVGLISPAGYLDGPEDIEYIREHLALLDLDLQIKTGDHVLDQYGYFAGSAADRAADVNAMFADPEVTAIIATRGGYGCTRILPLLDYDLIRSHPKILLGYSDITALLVGIYEQTGLITFHGPVGISSWNAYSNDFVKDVLVHGRPVSMLSRNPSEIHIFSNGTADGWLVGGNLSVFASMLGSLYMPDLNGAILFLEDVNEKIYRLDRILSQLQLSGVLDQLNGFIFGKCPGCGLDEVAPEDHDFTLLQILEYYLKPLGIPAWSGADFGHVDDKYTFPIGGKVAIDAEKGEIALVEKVVV